MDDDQNEKHTLMYALSSALSVNVQKGSGKKGKGVRLSFFVPLSFVRVHVAVES